MFYSGGVTILNGWLVSYFKEKGLSVPIGAVYLSFFWLGLMAVSYTHLRAHETVLDLVCRLLLEKKKKKAKYTRSE